jgi:hypothetical protein
MCPTPGAPRSWRRALARGFSFVCSAEYSFVW